MIIQTVSWEEFQDLLQKMPLMVEMHLLARAFLSEEVQVFSNPYDMAVRLDSLEPLSPHPMLALGLNPDLSYRFPALRLEFDPLTSELNKILHSRYELIQSLLLCQSRLSEEILRDSAVEAIILMLIDGLSYADLKACAPEWLAHTRPVLVDGVSNTEQGLLRIIGQPPLAERLFEAGFRQLIGYTYWARHEEPLTNRLFQGFGTQVYKVRSFEEVLERVKNLPLSKAFIQIVRTGLDGAAHTHRENPLKKAMVEAILRDFDRLAEVVRASGVSAILYLTSDHGVLWSDEHKLESIANDSGPPRYYEHEKRDPLTYPAEFKGRRYALLVYPYLRRQLRANEWGVHGGLSFEESIVPLIQLRI